MKKSEMVVQDVRRSAPIVSIKGTIDGQPAMWIGNMSQIPFLPVDLKTERSSARQSSAKKTHAP